MHLSVVWCIFLSAVWEEYKLDSFNEVHVLFLLSAYASMCPVHVHVLTCACVCEL